MRAEFEARLSCCRDLPSPPGIALQILAMAQDPDVVMATAADTIGLDVALTARMLRIANSPLYASRRRVDNLSQALTLLGLNATLTLALGFSLTSGLRPSGHGDAPCEEKVWRRSVISALASRLLGQRLDLHKLEELMLAGLLQDIGALVLLQLEPDAYRRILDDAPSQDELLLRERECFGCDHAEIGQWMARNWNLPALLQNAIGASESPVSASPFDACVAVSGYIADLWSSQDTDAARDLAMAQAHSRLGMDRESFDGVVEQMSLVLPDIAAMFDIRITQPERINAMLGQARELLVLRNLREIQDASRARKDADESASRVRQLAEEVRRDPLTGVYNRTQLEHVLKKEFEAATRHGWPLSIAFIDLDDFKQINDRWGHQVGDQVLRKFAETLQQRLRGSDIVARYGGEEFLAVLPGTGERAALAVIQRILSEVSTIAMVQVGGVALHITFSAGLATQGTVEQFASAEQLLKAADEALYGAKREGRNRVAAGNNRS
ncbi:HDOD domain-containing protein [Pseudoxanthomonas wuyuanensis]